MSNVDRCRGSAGVLRRIAPALLLLGLGGCVSVEKPLVEVRSEPEPLDTRRVPQTRSHEEAQRELERAYQRLQYLEQRVRELEADKEELKRQRDRYKDERDRYREERDRARGRKDD